MRAVRSRVAAVVAAAVLLVAAVVTVALLSGDEEEDRASGRVADAAGRQLSYLARDSAAVLAVDLRYEKRNWGHLRTVASRVLREYRSIQGDDTASVPPNLTGLLNSLTGFAGLSFENDVQPVLDGYLAMGIALPPRRPLPERLARLGDLLGEEGAASFSPQQGGYVRYPALPPRPGGRPPRPRLLREQDGTPVTQAEGQRYFEAIRRREEASEPRTVVAYRTPGGGLRRIVEKVFEGDAPKKLDGYDDVRLLDQSSALVGDDTIVLAQGGDTRANAPRAASPELRRALDRARAGRGFPPARLERAQRRSGSEDPFVLATGDLRLGRIVADEPNLERARRAVPYLAAIRDFGAAVDLHSDKAVATARIATDASGLRASDLPVAAPGKVELPVTPSIAGASRDQSVTTSFAARVARELFAQSGFVRAVERAERDLRIRFEDEVLRQFDCPSISVFDARSGSFGARSCLRDPAAMRELLPRLARHLPRIVTGLQGLGDEGLLALLLVAPDAPLTPTLPLGAITVRPPAGDEARGKESLYEIAGLRDSATRAARAGPERVVFGMIGDDFVVASDRRTARRVARLTTRERGVRTSSSTRVPGPQLVGGARGGDEATAVARVLRELVVDVSADRSALIAKAELTFGD